MMRPPSDGPKPGKSIGQQFIDALYEEGFDFGQPAPPLAAPFVEPHSSPTVRLVGSETPVWSVAVSPDDSHALSGSGWHGQAGPVDCNVRLWDLATASEKICMRGHSGHVNAVAFSPDGYLAVSVSDDRTVRHWDLRTGMQSARFGGHHNSVKALAYARHGQWLVSGGADRTIRFSTPDGQPLASYEGHTDTVLCLALSPDARILASGSEDKTFRLWDLSKGTEVLRLDRSGWVTSIAFSRDGSLLAFAGMDETVLFDVSKLQPIQSLPTRGAPTFSPIDDTILINTGQQVQLWKVGGEAPQTVYLTGQILSLAFFNHTKCFITGDYNRTLRVWDIAI